MKKNIFYLCIFCFFFQLHAQKQCWVLFKYKGNFNSNIEIKDSSLLPINSCFLRILKETGVLVINESKWINAVYIEATNKQIKLLNKLSFVKEIVYQSKLKISVCTSNPAKNQLAESEILRRQISFMQGEIFVKKNITGKGVKIGVIDIGFAGYKNTKELNHLITGGHIKAAKSFSNDGLEFGFQKNHGTEVLSCLAGKTDSVNIGLATEADYYLATYRKVSELIAALEWFHEQGVMIVNNSTKIDFSYFNKDDLNGEKVLATRALAEAAKNGMLIFSSVGNEGGNFWRYLVAPADAKGIISVGSISPLTKLRSSFSSFGPSFDKRIKPELTAVGEAVVANQNKLIGANGTSYSTPLLAGFAACAWQLHPLLSKDSLYQHLLKAGNLYPYFDYAHGYGIPQANYFIQLNVSATKTNDIAPIIFEEKNDSLFFFVNKLFFEHLINENSDGIFSSEIKLIHQKLALIYNGKLMKREGNYKLKAEEEDLNGENYVFYHLEDEFGFLKKYCVLKLENENIFFLLKSSIKSGYTLRICFKGYTLEKKF